MELHAGRRLLPALGLPAEPPRRVPTPDLDPISSPD
jgi:hypothetical protein